MWLLWTVDKETRFVTALLQRRSQSQTEERTMTLHMFSHCFSVKNMRRRRQAVIAAAGGHIQFRYFIQTVTFSMLDNVYVNFVSLR